MDDKDSNLSQKLSQNLLEILNDEEYYDIIIEVGNDPNIKIFRAHMVILDYRSSYLRRILATNKKKIDETLMVQIKLPNILPEIFHIILRYIYGGKLSLEDYDNLDIIKILIASNELNLQELVTYIQSFMIKNKADWMEQNFNLIYQTSFENKSFLELQGYCIDLMCNAPDKIFKSLDFISIPEKILVALIQSDNLQMSEIQIWEYVLKWGLAQNPGLSSNPSNYSKNDFATLKNTLQQCMPFIRFHGLTSKEFANNILPYKKVLPDDLYKGLLESFLGLQSDSKLNYQSKPRTSKKAYRSVPIPPIHSAPPPAIPYYSEYPVTNVNSLKQNINETREINDPLFTKIQPSTKNPNYDEGEEPFLKHKKRNRRRRRKSKKFTPRIEDPYEEKLSSWNTEEFKNTRCVEERIKNTWKKPVNNKWEEPANDTWNIYVPGWNSET
ncbi:BTB/POZ protein [Rhizophagus clarus]|nr:BTB/POZ protein [Rhizophagus clarus]